MPCRCIKLSERFSLRDLVAGLFLVGVSLVANAYDDDRTISDVDFNKESFLDINANEFHRSQDMQWLHTANGFRIAGASISSNRLALYSDLKLRQNFSPAFLFSLDWQQDDFYSNSPTTLPQLGLTVFPVEESEIGVGVIGTAAHDKRQADLGYAIVWGRKHNDFVRAKWLKVDVFYNEKNEFDDSRYAEHGETLSIDGVKQLSDKCLLSFEFVRDRPLALEFDAASGNFKHDRVEYSFSTYYQYSIDTQLGAKARVFEVAKARQDTVLNQAQDIRYQSAELFWIERIGSKNTVTTGLRYDDFREDMNDRLVVGDSYDYSLVTSQAYASLNHRYASNHAFDAGVYLGWSLHGRDYLGLPSTNRVETWDEGLEAKFRGSWEYHSNDRQSVLRFSLSLNLDDLFRDPGDGGGIYYQARF